MAYLMWILRREGFPLTNLSVFHSHKGICRQITACVGWLGGVELPTFWARPCPLASQQPGLGQHSHCEKRWLTWAWEVSVLPLGWGSEHQTMELSHLLLGPGPRQPQLDLWRPRKSQLLFPAPQGRHIFWIFWLNSQLPQRHSLTSQPSPHSKVYLLYVLYIALLSMA